MESEVNIDVPEPEEAPELPPTITERSVEASQLPFEVTAEQPLYETVNIPA